MARERQPVGDDPRTRVPARPKPPKPPKPPKKDPFAGLPGFTGPGGKVVMPGDAIIREQRQQIRKRKETIRRQQILRSQGYNIVVDGTWGPRSQRAWREYLQRSSFVRKPDPRNREDLTKPTTLGFARQTPSQPTKAEKAEIRRLEKQRAKVLAERERKQQRADILQRAKSLRRDPQAAGKMSLRELTEVLVDKEAKFDPTRNEAAARAVQWHLRSKGYSVQVNGNFDVRTYAMLKRAFADEAAREEADQKRLLVARFYDGGLVKPGDKPWWWNHGPMPEPSELLKQLQAGGFTADMMWRNLLRHAEASGVAWETVKQQQLASIVANLAPGSTSGVLTAVGGDASAPLWQLYADIHAIQDLLPFGDYSRSGLTEEERLKHLQRRAQNKEMVLRNAQAVSELRSRVATLIGSSSAEQFKRVWAAMVMVEDEKFKRFQQQIAAQDSSWWGDALEAIVAPGEFLRTATVYNVMRGTQLLVGDGARDVRWEDAMVTLGRDPGIPYDGLVSGSANPLLRFGLELTYDPLNHLRPFRWGSALASGSARAAGRATTLGGYHLTGEGLAMRLTYSKGTWDKAALLDRLIHLDDPLGSIDSAYGRKLAEVARRMGQTKDEAMGAVTRRLELHANHGFRKPSQKTGYTPPKIGKSDVQKLLDDSAQQARQNIVQLPALRALVDTLVQAKASLWATAERLPGELSQYGATINAYLMENYRPLILYQIAAELAQGRYRAVMAEVDDKVAAQAAAQDEFMRIRDGAGSYLKGGGMAPELQAVEFVGADMSITMRNVEEELEKRLELARVQNRKVILPAIQDYLEEQADIAFERARKQAAQKAEGVLGEEVLHGIWDENGLWRNRFEVADGDLVDAIRQSFDEPFEMDNPMYNVGRTQLEYRDAVRKEISRGVGRLDSYVTRNLAAQTLRDFDYAEAQRVIEKEVHEAWEERADGLWYDTRPKLNVSNLYARHIDAAAKFRLLFDEDGVDMLAVLGEFRPQFIPPPIKKTTVLQDTKVRGGGPSEQIEADVKSQWRRTQHRKIEDGLYDFAKMMVVGAEKQVPGGFHAPGNKGGLWGQRELLKNAMNLRMHALREAEAVVLSNELLKQGAVWRAAQHAQSLPVRIAYKALAAQLAVWKFATLALRPGWLVRNVVDNVAKGLIQGVRDPRLFLIGPGKALMSVLDAGIGVIRQMIRWCDELFGTSVARHFDTILEHFWRLPSRILERAFKASNIEVPPEVLEGNFARSLWDKDLGLDLTPEITADARKELEKQGFLSPQRVRGPVEQRVRDTSARAAEVGAKFRDTIWHVMGEMPEQHMRRVIYRSEFNKALKELTAAPGGRTASEIQLEATDRAINKVNDTLFDYSQISVLEDNIQVFFPFIQFWRKNTPFWVESFATKPWLNNAVLQFDSNRREEWHLDQPAWMRRYFHTDEIADALAVVPGLDQAFDLLGLGDGAAFDPANMLSFAPFYRAFKENVHGESDFLPADKKGHAIFAPMIDALNDWGLGMSPFIRKPLESAGIANYRSWQRIFPQTALMEVIGERTGQDWLGKLGRRLERIASLGPLALTEIKTTDANAIADNFDFWVQTVVAEQVARGEEPDLAEAEETVKDWFFAQTLWGYFGGIYWRRATPEDMYLAKLQDDTMRGELDYDKLPAKDKQLLKLWSMRGYDRLTYDRYIALLPVIEAYYKGDLEAKSEIVKDHPEIVRWVNGDFTGNPVSQKFVRYAHRYEDQAMFFDALEIADSLDLPFELKKAAEDMFVSPELRDYWDKSRTGKRLRERMIQAEAHDYYRSLNSHYFAIPEDDFEARDSFLESHPELIRHWGMNNDPADDYDAIIGSARASLRDMYFGMVKQEGFDGAAAFLKEFPFMFEGTKSERKIKDGEWITGGGKWSAERQRDFHEAKPHLGWFFDKLLPKVGKDKAFGWLYESDAEAAKIIRAYFERWGKGGQRRLDYMQASPWLKLYFGMAPAERGAWLRGDSEGAKIIRAYFEKYANEKGLTQHARDYLDTKPMLNHYFSLPKESREEWLRSGDPRAEKVLAYFKKYGKKHQFERAFKQLVAKYPGLADGTPEQAKRIAFWQQYFSLSPDRRPSFVMEQAEKHGIFIYGEFGETERHDREQEFLRRAVGLGLSKRQAAFLYVKPLLDFYRTLPASQKALFSRANPELQEYFDKYSTKSLTGDKKLDRLVEEYFSFPPDSFARSRFLREHPEVQDWFNGRNPAEGAMRTLLDQYFNIENLSEREQFLAHHPELDAYFERRREEKRIESLALHAFDRSDPRLRPFYEDAADLERAAERMRARLRQSAINALSPDNIETRRERRPTAA